MSDTNMGDVDSVSQDGQQPDANNGDQVQPITEPDEDQQSDFVSHDDQIDQNTAEYHANVENRQRHDHEWWGTRHKYPQIGDPDREFIFARNLPISSQDVRDVVAAYNNVATNEGTEPFNTLGVSMRPTTPPMERAKKQVDGLVEQGFEVTRALIDEIYEKSTRDSGLIAALQEYCRNGDDVPNAHANELLKMLDRLKALMSDEMVKYSEQFQELSDDFDDYRKHNEERVEKLEERRSEAESKLAEAKDRLECKQMELNKIQQQGGVDPNDHSTKQTNELKEENFVLSKKLKRLEEEIAQGKEDRDQLQNGFDEKANGLSQSEEKVVRLLKEKAALQSKIVMYEAGKTREQVECATEDDFDVIDEHKADLEAAEERAKIADSEREEGNRFHQQFYKVMKEKVSTWEARATTADDDAKQHGSTVSSNTVELLQEVAHDWDEMVLKFQKSWPPAQGAFHGGQIEYDNITKESLEKSNRELREKYEENQRHIRNMAQQEVTLTDEFEKINKKISDNEKKIEALKESIKQLEELKEKQNKLRAKASSSSSSSSQRAHTDPPSDSDPESPKDHFPPSGHGNKKSSSPASSPPDDIQWLNDELSKYQDYAALHHDMIEDLQNANEKLTGRLEQLEGRNEELERQHQENQDEFRNLETQRTSLLEQNTSLMRERNDLQADIEKVRGEKEELEKLQKDNIEKLEGLEKEKEQLESERATNQTELKKLQNDKDKLEKLRQDDSKRFKERIEAEQKKRGDLQVDAKQLNDLRVEKAQLEWQHATDQDDLEKARTENRGLTRERDDLKQSLEKKHQETKGLRQENQQLQVDHKEQKRRLEKNIEALQECHASNDKALEALRQQGISNYQSADALIRAAGALRTDGRPVENYSPTKTGDSLEMSLMDRINYLNLSVFLRTRNYVELALREGCNRLANMLIHDAKNWAEQCAEDLSKMNPSVNVQVRASMYVLNGLKRVMVAKDMEEINKGAREFKYGQKMLVREDADPATFGQLIELAGSLVDWLDRLNIEHDSPERRRGLQADKVSWKKNMEFVVKRRAKKLQSGMKDDPNLKANALRRTGLHSPLTPEKWDEDIGLDIYLSDDEVVARRQDSQDDC